MKLLTVIITLLDNKINMSVSLLGKKLIIKSLFPFIIRQMMRNSDVPLFSFGFAQSSFLSFLSFSVFSCQKMETGEKQREREEVGCIQLTMQSRTPL